MYCRNEFTTISKGKHEKKGEIGVTHYLDRLNCPMFQQLAGHLLVYGCNRGVQAPPTNIIFFIFIPIL
jgi:hypothetical protein